MKKNRLPILLAPTWLIITTILLCLPGAVLPREAWFDKIWLDKWIHIGLFSCLVFFWCWLLRALEGKDYSRFLQAFFYFLLYGVGMELIQKYLIPNRSFDFKDIVADCIGCGLGLLLAVKRL